MTPTEYEHYVASLLAAEGWETQVSPAQRDWGLDVICERDNRRLGVQVKMYGASRAVNSQIVMQLHGAAAFRDCDRAMIVTDGRVLSDATAVAEKLGIAIRIEPVPEPISSDLPDRQSVSADGASQFDEIWANYVMPLEGQTLERSDGTTNEILAVDWSGLRQVSSRGNPRNIDIEIFRWAVVRLLNHDVVLRSEINDQYPKRASSGIMLVLSSLPMFESVQVGSKTGLRLVERA